MSNLTSHYTLTPLPDDFELGPEFDAMQQAAQPDTVQRIAAIIAEFDGSNQTALAKRICNMIFEGEPIADE